MGKHELSLNPLDLASLTFPSTLLIDCESLTTFPDQSASYGLRSFQFKDIFVCLFFFFPPSCSQFYLYFKVLDLPGIKLHSSQLSLDAECYQEDVLNFTAAFHKWMLLIQENPFQPAK